MVAVLVAAIVIPMCGQSRGIAALRISSGIDDLRFRVTSQHVDRELQLEVASITVSLAPLAIRASEAVADKQGGVAR